MWWRRLVWKLVPEHRKTTFRVRFGRLVFDHIPMLHENATVDPDNIGGDPVSGKAVSGKTSVGDHVIALSNDQSVLVF